MEKLHELLFVLHGHHFLVRGFVAADEMAEILQIQY